jgi:hypothetical protein
MYMGGSAASGSNAFKKVFWDPESFVHVQTIWCNHNKAKLRVVSNHNKFKSDLMKLNYSMWIPEMVPIVLNLMY